MKVGFAFFADFAQAHPDGKVYVVGGGIQRVIVKTYPFAVPLLSLVVRLDFDQEECGKPHHFELQGIDPAGEPMFPPAVSDFTPQKRPEGMPIPTLVHIVFNMQSVRLPTPGKYDFQIKVDSALVATPALHAFAGEPPDAEFAPSA